MKMNAINLDSLVKFSKSLNENEIDNLKYKLFLLAIDELNKSEKTWDLLLLDEGSDLNTILKSLVQIQPYNSRIKDFGLAYKGRPTFMTDDLLYALIKESEEYKLKAKANFNQYIYQVETENNEYVCETFANSSDLLDLVTSHAGPVIPSFITSYIYYFNEGNDSKPHVDNAFTSITVMVGLKHEFPDRTINSSSSFIYWANKKPLHYRLLPGEIAIFFGCTVIHGRTPVKKDESINSLLISFRPRL